MGDTVLDEREGYQGTVPSSGLKPGGDGSFAFSEPAGAICPRSAPFSAASVSIAGSTGSGSECRCRAERSSRSTCQENNEIVFFLKYPRSTIGRFVVMNE